MLNKKMLLTVTALASMAFAGSAFASEPSSLYRDADGQLHYKMCKAGQSLMKASDIDAHGNWQVPAEVLSMKFEPRPVHEVFGLTEDEYEAEFKGEGGVLPVRHIKAETVTPLQEVYAANNPEVEKMNSLEFQNWLDRFVGAN